MCGIYAHLHYGINKHAEYKQDISLTRRGPDEFREYSDENYYAAFYRLAIVGENGHQPFIQDEIILLVNGEIYNHEKYNTNCITQSDCEVILHMYKQYGIDETIRRIDGEFSIILIDKMSGTTYVCRDRYGVKPLYYSITHTGEYMTYEISSLISPLHNHVEHIKPGRLYTMTKSSLNITLLDYYIGSSQTNHQSSTNANIYKSLVRAVEKRITHSDRPIGFLLSGGLDSSIILALALRSGKLTHPPLVFTFCFDLDAPDVKAARIMVDHLRKQYGPFCINYRLITPEQLGYTSHEKGDKQIQVNVEAGLSYIPEVIEALESFDTTTIRASTPMYMLCKWISEHTDVKVILSGEGSDELFGGYLYMMYAPTDEAFAKETVKLMNELYLYDNLRADRSSASHGLEIRPPFLDTELVYNVQSSGKLVKPKQTTKELLREVIHIHEPTLLPQAILHGKKEAFSDAVGYNWKQSIIAYAKTLSFQSDNQLSPHIHASTPEAKMFQTIFKKTFGNNKWHLLPKLWLPNSEWVDTNGEPSATALSVYKN